MENVPDHEIVERAKAIWSQDNDDISVEEDPPEISRTKEGAWVKAWVWESMKTWIVRVKGKSGLVATLVVCEYHRSMLEDCPAYQEVIEETESDKDCYYC